MAIEKLKQGLRRRIMIIILIIINNNVGMACDSRSFSYFFSSEFKGLSNLCMHWLRFYSSFVRSHLHIILHLSRKFCFNCAKRHYKYSFCACLPGSPSLKSSLPPLLPRGFPQNGTTDPYKPPTRPPFPFK